MRLDHLLNLPPPLLGDTHVGLLRLALWIGLGTIAVALLMLVAILLLRVRLIMRRRRDALVKTDWQPVLARCVYEAPADLPLLEESDHYAFLLLWNGYFESLRGTARDNLRLLAVAAGAPGFARHLAESRRVRDLLIGITTLGHLADLDAAPTLRALAAHESSRVSLAAARALLEIDPDASLSWMTDMVGQRDDWPLNRVAAMLTDVGADRITKPLVDATERAASGPGASGAVPRLLRLLELAHPEAATPALRRVLDATTDPDAIAACLRALSGTAGAAAARMRLNHPDWRVRCAAAHTLGRLGTPEDRRMLVDLLSDRHWWVRRHAALALIAMPSVTPAALRTLCRALPDRFASDMLRQVLAESE